VFMECSAAAHHGLRPGSYRSRAMALPTSVSRRSSSRHRDPLARVARLEVAVRRERDRIDPLVTRRLLLAARAALAVTAVSVVTRVLGPSESGAIAVVATLVWLAVRSVTLGPASVMDREVRDMRTSPDVLATDGVIAGVLSGVPLACIGVLVTAPVFGVGTAMVAVALATIALVVSLHLAYIGRLAGRCAQVSGASTIALAIGAGATLVHAIDRRLTIDDVALVWSGAAVASTALLMIVLRHDFDVFDEESIRRLLRATVPGAMVAAPVVCAWLFGLVAVARASGAEDAGRFSLAVGAAHLFMIGALELSAPSVGASDERRTIDALSLATRRAILTLSGSALVAASTIAVAIGALTGVHDAAVAAAAALLLPGAAALVIRRPLTLHLRERGDTPWLVPLDVFGLLGVMTVDSLVAGRWSFVAVAAATSVGCLILLAATVALFADRSDRTVRSVVRPTEADIRWLLAAETRAVRHPAVK